MTSPVRHALMISVAIGSLTVALQASAQTAPAATAQDTAPPAEEATAKVEEIVVTGTARSSGLRKLDTSFSITTATAAEIRQAIPVSSADLLKIVPGVFVESSGGETGANIFVRGFPGGGDAPYVTYQIDGSPIYAAPTLSFLENSSLFRQDDTVKRVEILRGGSSPIFSNGQPGITANYIQRTGGENPEGSLRLTGGFEGSYRADVFYGGKIADNWYASIGGFYRSSNGVRSSQFPADRGGQVVGTLKRKFENGSVTFYARRTDDRNLFVTAVPLLFNNGKYSAFPGFNPLKDTFAGNELRRVTIEVAPGNGLNGPQTITRDLADGRGTHVTVLGANIDLTFNGWTVSDKAGYTTGDAPTNALFNGQNPQSLDSYIADRIASVNSNAAIVAASTASGGIGLATAGTGRFANGGGAVAGTQQVEEIGFWVVDKQIKSFTNDLRVSRDIFSGNTITLGTYFADYSSNDRWYLNNPLLVTVSPNARLVDVALNNGVRVSRPGTGIVGGQFFDVNASYNATNIAIFLADEWSIGDKLKIDGGIRWENHTSNGTLENQTSGDFDGNLLTLYNNNSNYLIGTYTNYHDSQDGFAYTVGANYYVLPRLSVFARINGGYLFPQFDDYRSALNANLPNGFDPSQAPKQKIYQYEIGVKTVTPLYSVFLTGFYNIFKGVPFTQFLADGTQRNLIGGTRAYGLEFEGSLRPIEHLELTLTGDLQDASYRSFVGQNFNGNRAQRQPRLQFRFTPTYTIPTPVADLHLFMTYTHVGFRYADIDNRQPLPTYDTFDAGLTANVGKSLEIFATASNFTDELALTEGNARVVGTNVANGIASGRAINGRTVHVGIAYHF